MGLRSAVALNLDDLNHSIGDEERRIKPRPSSLDSAKHWLCVAVEWPIIIDDRQRNDRPLLRLNSWGQKRQPQSVIDQGHGT